MADEVEKPRGGLKWGIPVSVAVHAVLGGILILGLPIELPTPQEEEAVTVEIVEPPPEPEMPPEPEPEPEEQSEPEVQPEPEPEAAQPPPPPEPEKAPEPTPPPPEPEAPTEEEAAATAPVPVLRPVFEFGEEATGPKVSPEGNSSAEGAQPPAEEEPVAEPQDNPSPETAAALAALSSEAENAADEATGPPETVEDLPEAKTLFSVDITEDPLARTSMKDIPRSMRATQLCETELTEQLRNASPPRDPDFIPRSPLSEGTTLELQRTAFRAKGQWYDLSFRCNINDDATKVVGFAFEIGQPVPRSQWKRRGFPGS